MGEASEKDASGLADPMEVLGAGVLGAIEDVAFPAALLDLEGRIRWQNRASRELVGDARGRLVTSVVDPAEREASRDLVAQVRLGRGNTDFSTVVIAPDGTRRGVRGSGVPVRSADGRSVVGMLGLGRELRPDSLPDEAGSRLTPREREILNHLAAGRSTPQMAELMVISPETVRNHVRRVLRKLDAQSRLEAVAKAYRAGLV